MKKLPHFAFRRCQGFPAQRSGSVHSPERLAVSLLGRSQVPLLLEALKKRIQAPRTDAVSMARQLLDHSQTEDRAFHGVVDHMEPDQARVQIAVGRGVVLLCLRFRHLITNSDMIRTKSSACQVRSPNLQPPDETP